MGASTNYHHTDAMRLMCRPSPLIGLLLPTATGCAVITALQRVEQPATIVFTSDVSTIVAPDTVARGVPFEVKFSSYESKCTEPSRDEVTVQSDSVVIRAFVTRTLQCGDALMFLTHAVLVQANTAGRFRIYVNGRNEHVGGAVSDTTLTRSVVVR